MTVYLTVVRDPDASNTYLTDSDDLVYLDIDLGSSFTGSPDDEEQAIEWAEGMMESLAIFPKDTTAYSGAIETILTALENYDEVASYVTHIDSTRPLHPYERGDVEGFTTENIRELADLDGLDPDTPNVVVSAGHDRSWDDPDVFGPYDTAREARAWVLEQYKSGDFDPHGCTVTYKQLVKR